MRRNDERLEKIVQQASQPKSQDDVTIKYVIYKGQKIPILEDRHELRFMPDPNNPDILIPYTVNEVGYRLDDRGRSFMKLNDVGCCRFGCTVNVKALYECSHCRRSVCKRHIFCVGRRIYCRKGTCAWAGRTYQLFRAIYRLIRFCFASVR